MERLKEKNPDKDEKMHNESTKKRPKLIPCRLQKDIEKERKLVTHELIITGE